MSESCEIVWFLAGKTMSERPEEGNQPVGDEALLHRYGGVRIVTGALGTEMRWATFAPCIASLTFASEMLSDFATPYVLRYFLYGWFEEDFDTASRARRRIFDIMKRSDIHLMRRVFIRSFEPVVARMPLLLHNTWIDGQADPESSVDCIYEPSSGRFHVERIGAASSLARHWGMAPVSYPCSTSNSYGRAVSEAYTDVLRSGRPRYDHVYAAMQKVDGTVVWAPYQRIILPLLRSRGRPGVTVVTESAKVGFTIV